MAKPTIVMLLGSSGSGKTGLATAMETGATHLIGVKQLHDLAQGRVRIGDSDAITRAHKAGGPFLPLVKEQMGDADCLLLETWFATPRLYAECKCAFDVMQVWVLTPQWMCDTRILYRYTQLGDVAAYGRVIGRRDKQAAISDVAIIDQALTLLPICTPLLLDGRDYPLQEIAPEAARMMMDAPRSTLVLDAGTPRCQPAVRIGNEWHGKLSWVDFEQARLDAILPADMTGMSVLDVGACNGGFSLEATNRGALSVMAVDIADNGLSELRTIRDAYRLPIGTALMDATVCELPVLRVDATPYRYSLALLLNILHRVADPEALLQKVMDVSDAVVLEAPFCATAYDHATKTLAPAEPVKPKWARYPGTWHFPPAWVQRIAEEAGFELREMMIGAYMPEQRMIFKLERK